VGLLTKGLRTGQPQNEASGNVFGLLYRDPDRLRQFLSSMTGVSMGSARALAQKFPWNDYRSVLDVGTAQGNVPIQLCVVKTP
jgi:hypothetical protein